MLRGGMLGILVRIRFSALPAGGCGRGPDGRRRAARRGVDVLACRLVSQRPRLCWFKGGRNGQEYGCRTDGQHADSTSGGGRRGRAGQRLMNEGRPNVFCPPVRHRFPAPLVVPLAHSGRLVAALVLRRRLSRLPSMLWTQRMRCNSPSGVERRAIPTPLGVGLALLGQGVSPGQWAATGRSRPPFRRCCGFPVCAGCSRDACVPWLR